jgi:hypothetical protein
MARVRSAAGNLALLLVSTAGTWLLVELVVFPAWIHRVPLRLHERIVNGAVRTLAQSSKAGARPEAYVALIGDSYSAGEGDWRLTVDAGRNPPHHTAHLIHAATGRDVVSFGHAGAGSQRGVVTDPITQVDYLQRTLRFAIDDPDEILFYFYEGNDLDDNIEDLARRYDPRFEPGRPAGRIPDPERFARFLDEVVIAESEIGEKLADFRLSHNLYVLRSLRWWFDRWRAGNLPRTGPRPQHPREARSNRRGEHSSILVGGERLETPMALQAPAPELTPQETRTALWVVEQALRRTARRFDRSTLRVLYVPSPILCYPLPDELEQVQEDHHRPDRPLAFDSRFLVERSDALCAEVAAIAARLGMAFHDSRPALRAAGAEQVIHGPRDWKHLNRAGYEALAPEAISLLEAQGPGARCARLAD